jgi:hypothetical protein
MYTTDGACELFDTDIFCEETSTHCTGLFDKRVGSAHSGVRRWLRQRR